MSLFLKLIFFFVDLIFLNLAILLSYHFFNIQIFGSELSNSIYLFIFSNLASAFLALVSSPYQYSRNSGIAKLFKAQSSFLLVHLLVVASLIILFKKSYSPFQVGALYAMFVFSFFVSKLFIFYIYSLFEKQNLRIKNVVIIGSDESARETRKHFQ